MEYISYLPPFFAGIILGLFIRITRDKRQLKKQQEKINDLNAEIWSSHQEILELQKSKSHDLHRSS
ncbi:MAG: hypothetical protein C5B59_09510 [Bacteroidetes bacterium]|nr:MAG: hypothetical protein C5B59_09510 [Bacteroidota bacterium]